MDRGRCRVSNGTGTRLRSKRRCSRLWPAYRDRSLTAKVPALEHDDFWLAESSAIAEYLEEAFPPPGHPALKALADADKE